MIDVELSQDELRRYSRHFNLNEVGIDGQKRLKQAKVLCVGAGGLGSPLLLYLAAAGVGTLGIIDDDIVEASNLQRQVLYGEKTFKALKAESAKERLLDLNPNINIKVHSLRLSHDNARQIIRDYDLVADGTDNFATRFVINDACVYTKIPNVYASIFQFEGQCSVFAAAQGPCYRCLYPAPPPPGLVPNCAEGGVLGVLPGVMGTIQATEVCKMILGVGAPLLGRLLIFDALSMRFRELKIKRATDCIVCNGNIPFEDLPHHQTEPCAMTQEIQEISVKQLKNMKDNAEPFFLLDVREQHEYDICHLNGHLIPLAQLSAHLDELPVGEKIIVHCKSGGRSARAVSILNEAGFKDVYNVSGGILAWGQEIDHSIEPY